MTRLALLAELTRGGVLPVPSAVEGSSRRPEPVEGSTGDVGRGAGLIYGADLVGACLGAFLSSALLIPVLGIPQTCYAVALLSLAGVMLLV